MEPQPPSSDITPPMGGATAGGLFGMAGGGVSDPSLPEQAGERIGPYKLREQIGEGGFGSVWAADQEEPIQRRVALKIIKLGMDTKDVVARFEQERQALALMDHPNIAKVLDAGATQWGRPFFVMELVRGIRITDYCDQASLPTIERLKLFMQVCQAVQHAHQKGIIHRDLKPSNILVTLHDGVPVPKVIDFGIAKATQGRLTDKTIYTQFKHMIGTPLYMSPEQAELSGLDVDTRSDVYSLGVLLYELLVGRTPFDSETLMKAGLDEMRRVIREQEPPKPSTALQTMTAEMRTTVAARRKAEGAKMAGLLRGDLDWIVMKSLEKDRTRRYGTANGFAEDIRRYLVNEPVTAAAPGAMYRIRKFARRNRGIFAAGSAVTLALVAGIATSSWQAVRATKAESRATERAAAEAAAREDAEAVTKFLTTVFESPDPARYGRAITVVEMLHRAAAKLDTDLGSQPSRRALLQGVLGNTYSSLGLAREAIPLQEKARDACMKFLGSEAPETLAMMSNLANSHMTAGHREEALLLREQVFGLRRKLLGPDHPETLTAMSSLAQSHANAEHAEKALQLREQVLNLRRKLLGPEHPDTIMAMNDIANSYFDSGHHEEALQLREKVLQIQRRILGPGNPITLVTIDSLANSYLDAGRNEEALQLHNEVLGLDREVFGPEHPVTLNAMNNLANSKFELGQHGEALQLRKQVLDIQCRVLSPKHPSTLITMDSLANSYLDAGRHAEALQLHEQALQLDRDVYSSEHPVTLNAMNNLAKSYSHASRHEDALLLRQEALKIHQKVFGDAHANTIAAMKELAFACVAGGHRGEARQLREQVLQIQSNLFGFEHLDTLNAMTSLAGSYLMEGRIEEATRLQEKSLKVTRRILTPGHPSLTAAITNLAACYEATGRRQESQWLHKELKLFDRKASGSSRKR